MAGKIFVNYRRADSRDAAARIRDRLAQAFGRKNVFMDVDNLQVGERFDSALAKALSESNIFIAIIGPRWLEEFGSRQRQNEDDFVRKEIAAALARGILVVPVTLERCFLPRPNQLPDDVAAFVMHQKHDVSHESFARDMTALVDAIKTARKQGGTWWRGSRWTAVAVAMTFLVTTSAILVFHALRQPLSQVETPESIDANVNALLSAARQRAYSELVALDITERLDQFDLRKLIALYESTGDRIQISTAPDNEGVARRIEFAAQIRGASKSWWGVFALKNTGKQRRFIVLKSSKGKLVAVTASLGEQPAPTSEHTGADYLVWKIEPGQVVTYAAELTVGSLPEMLLFSNAL